MWWCDVGIVPTVVFAVVACGVVSVVGVFCLLSMFYCVDVAVG